MSFTAAERAPARPTDGDRAANSLRQLRQNVALLERLCDMVEQSGSTGPDAELSQQIGVQRGVVEDLASATRRHMGELLQDAEEAGPATARRRRAAHVAPCVSRPVPSERPADSSNVASMAWRWTRGPPNSRRRPRVALLPSYRATGAAVAVAWSEEHAVG